MRTMVNRYGHLAQWDLSCWFYQIPLSTQVQRYFGVRINGEEFAFCCLPMGFVASVYVAQQLTLAASAEIEGRLVYIDNIFTGCKDQSEAITTDSELCKRLAEVEVELKLSASEHGDELDILGVHCNAREKTIRLSEEFVKKHSQALQETIDCKSVRTTTRGLMKLIGMLFRGVYVLQLGFHNYDKILRTASAIALLPLNAPLEWKIDDQTKALAMTIHTNAPVTTIFRDNTRESGPVIATDASLSGYGYLWTHRGRVVAGSGVWPEEPEDNMPKLEGMAAAIAIKALEYHGYRVKGSTLHTDSETLIKACKRGHSTKCPELNTTIAYVKELNIGLTHVPSEENPADGSSRGIPVSKLDLQKLDNLC